MSALTKEDEIKVAEYRKTLDRYPRPSVTADIVAVRPAYGELAADEWRKNPAFALEVLLVKRGRWPYAGRWALPGGFVGPDESVEEGARRELREETALEAERLLPIGVFSAPDRDLRARIISNAFVSIHGRGEGASVKGGDDVTEAKWLQVRRPLMGGGYFSLPFWDGDTPRFTLSGTYEPAEFGGGRILKVAYNPLAFDHAEIIAQSFLRMLSYDVRKLAFFFLPEKFTLGEYIDVYQYLTRYSIAPNNIPNFRRQLTKTGDRLLEECEDGTDLRGRGHRAGKLYRRRVTA